MEAVAPGGSGLQSLSANEVSLTIAPAYNALNSLALLNEAPPGGRDRRRGPESALQTVRWVGQKARAMTVEQREMNRLLLDGLWPGLYDGGEWENFPRYLAHLEHEEPEVLRDNIRVRMAGDEPASDLRQAVDELLEDSTRLQEALVTHLRAMWEIYLEPEWERSVPALEALLPYYRRRMAGHGSPPEMLGALNPRAQYMSHTTYDELSRAERVVFVVSPHMEALVRGQQAGDTLWVVFGRPGFQLLLRESPVGKAELMVRLRTLADETCLRILALLAEEGELSAQEIMNRLEMTQPTASRHLSQLTSAGYLLESRRGGAAKFYSLLETGPLYTFQGLQQLLLGETEEQARPERTELGRFLIRDGRVGTWPGKRKDQALVLEYLASRFEPSRQYTEREVNELLTSWHTWNDPVSLRRYLFDEGLLNRTSDGARYWCPSR